MLPTDPKPPNIEIHEVHASAVRIEVPVDKAVQAIVDGMKGSQLKFLEQISRTVGTALGTALPAVQDMVQSYALYRTQRITGKALVRAVKDSKTAVVLAEGITDPVVREEAKRAASLWFGEAMWHRQNLEETVIRAVPYITQDELPDEQPSEEFSAHWARAAKERSDPDIQEIFAQLLAAEYQSPGGTSIRSLNLVRTLTPAEAKLFRRACGVSFRGNTFGASRGKCYLIARRNDAPIDLTLDEILLLADAGLVTPSTYAWYSLEEVADSSGQGLMVGLGPVMLNVACGPGERLRLRGFPFTSSGNEMARVIDAPFHVATIKAFIECNPSYWFQPLIQTPTVPGLTKYTPIDLDDISFFSE